jgi:hypothetical protein
MIFSALKHMLSASLEDASPNVSVGFFYTGIDRQDHARGIHGNSSEMQLAQLQKAYAMQADNLRAHGAAEESAEHRLAMYRAADALEASGARAATIIEIEQSHKKAGAESLPHRPETSDSSGDDTQSGREARTLESTQALPLLKAENRCTADVMLARAERLAAAEPAQDVTPRGETRSITAEARAVPERAQPSAFDKMLSGISFDWAREASAEPQHMSDAASMRLTAPAFMLPDFAEMKRRMQGQNLVLAA